MIRIVIVELVEDLIDRLREADAVLRMVYLTTFGTGVWLIAMAVKLLDDSCKTVTFDVSTHSGTSLLVCYADATGSAPASITGYTLAFVASFFIWFPLIDEVMPI